MINLSFGLEYEVQLINQSDKNVVIRKFNNFLESGELLDFSYSSGETSFRLAPKKTTVVSQIMNIFFQYYDFNESTTHIHCDCSGYNVTNFKVALPKIPDSELDVILNRLIILTNYTVIKNKKAVAYDQKFNMVNIRSAFNTIEYRCFPVTFDSDLLLWQLQELSEIHMDLIQIFSGQKIEDRMSINLTSSDIKKRKIVYGNY